MSIILDQSITLCFSVSSNIYLYPCPYSLVVHHLIIMKLFCGSSGALPGTSPSTSPILGRPTDSYHKQ